MLSHPFAQLRHAFRPELALEYVLEILFTEQIQAVAGYAAQERMQDPGRHYPVARVQRRANQMLQGKAAAARPAFGEGVGVPGEIGDRAYRRQMCQAAFHAPENGPASRVLIAG